MSISTIHENELREALRGMTGSVDIIEASFTPWDDDQRGELDAVLRDLAGLSKLDDAIADAA